VEIIPGTNFHRKTALQGWMCYDKNQKFQERKIVILVRKHNKKRLYSVWEHWRLLYFLDNPAGTTY